MRLFHWFNIGKSEKEAPIRSDGYFAGRLWCCHFLRSNHDSNNNLPRRRSTCQHARFVLLPWSRANNSWVVFWTVRSFFKSFDKFDSSVIAKSGVESDMQVSISRTTSFSTRYKTILSALLGALVTGVTFFVREPVVAPLGHGVAGGASVLGFPVPYSTFAKCCWILVSSDSPPARYGNTYFFHPLGLLFDLAVWLAISFAIVFGFSLRRAMISTAAGLGLTLLSLLSGPLRIVAPFLALQPAEPMGFPYEYLFYNAGYSPIAESVSRGYSFSLNPALADFALWFGITYLVLLILSRDRFHYKKIPQKSEIQPM